MAQNETAKLQESIDELKDRIAKLEKENAELKGKSAAFEPDYWGTYYNISQRGEVRSATNFNQDQTDDEMLIGNCFKTREEAERFLEWLKARKVLLDDAKGFEPDWFDDDQRKWYLIYDTEDHEFDTDWSWCALENYGIYFETEEEVQKSLKEHEAEWRIFMGLPKKDPE